MKPILDRVAICGPDDTTNIRDMQAISLDFPFVEWGILLMKNKEGNPGYPSYNKVVDFLEAKLLCCGHLCGEWVWDFDGESWGVFAARPRYTEFQRFQLNFAGRPLMPKLVEGLYKSRLKQQVIFQVPDLENLVFRLAVASKLNVAGFFDTSRGKGKLPASWPKALEDVYCGYAGGLNPDNLEENLEKISQVANVPAWIDVQTGVAIEGKINFEKVYKFLTIAKKFVLTSEPNIV